MLRLEWMRTAPDDNSGVFVRFPHPEQQNYDNTAYVGVNFADLKARTEGYRVRSLPFRPGLEVSGRIRAVGPGVEGLHPGREVAALVHSGAYAEVVKRLSAGGAPLPAELAGSAAVRQALIALGVPA